MKRVLSAGDINDINDADLGNNCNDNMSTQVRGQRKKSKRVAAKSQSVRSTNITGATAATDDNNHFTTSVSASEMSQLQKTVEQLSTIIHDQQATICKLSNKLKFVLSFLDIADDELITDAAAHDTVGSGNSSSHVPAGVAVTAVTATMSDTGATSQHMSQPFSQSDGGTATTYAGITASTRVGGWTGQNNNLREAVAAAVYADQRDKERRSKSIIVSGLNSSSDNSDIVSFQRLCLLELGIDPVITHTRRLGHDDGSRVSPLLVGLQSAEEASRLLDHAKRLRRSTDDNVRNNVYINKNLSKLEARLAYEERCRRRQRQQTTRRTTSRRRDDQQSAQPGPAIGTTVNASTSVSTSTRALNSDATPFHSHTLVSVSSGDLGSSGDVANGGGAAAVGGSS